MATGPGSGARPHVRPLGTMLAARIALAVPTGRLDAYGATPLEPRGRVDLVREVRSVAPGATSGRPAGETLPPARRHDAQYPRSTTVETSG